MLTSIDGRRSDADPVPMSARSRASALPPFESVVAEYGANVWRFAASQVGYAGADEVFQETMLAAMLAYPSLREPAAVRTWLLRIAARKAIDSFRTAAKSPIPVAEPPEGADHTSPELELQRGSHDSELWAHARDLPDKQRQALALRVLLDLPYAEIAAVMQTSPAAARRNVFEALTKLRTAASNQRRQ